MVTPEMIAAAQNYLPGMPVKHITAAITAVLAVAPEDELKLRLDDDELQARRRYIGGSDANILMNGSPDEIHQLWMVKTEQADYQDLTTVLPVCIGIVTEALNRHWYQAHTGHPVVRANTVVFDSTYTFMRATLDGEVAIADDKWATWEAKHVNEWSDVDATVQKYMPQLHHNSWITGHKHAILSMLIGTTKWRWFEIEIDDFYQMQLIDREREFWNCIESMTVPAGYAPLEPPVPSSKMREVNMQGDNFWAVMAEQYLSNKDEAKLYDLASKALKDKMAADVGRAYGHGIQVKRGVDNRRRISLMKE